MDKLSYALGLGIGRQLADMGAPELVVEDFALAVKDMIGGQKARMSFEEAQTIVEKFFMEKEREKAAANAKKGAAAKAEGEKYLAENARKEGVVTTASGLQYTVLKEGTGGKPTATDKVRCHYEGFLTDGTVFDSSIQRGTPADFPLNGVISGWTEGLQLMAEGAKYRFFIPYQLAYGERGAGAMIPPYAALIFDVELIQVL